MKCIAFRTSLSHYSVMAKIEHDRGSPLRLDEIMDIENFEYSFHFVNFKILSRVLNY